MPSNTVEDEYDDDYHSQTSDQSSNPSAVAMIQETEKLEEEAERMKGLGNKYMANKVNNQCTNRSRIVILKMTVFELLFN